ncbi:hypothetical protein Scep_024309 [Stephania cephalantha]|uniref:Uncharacterized protein n=1 Tax=Stephania cephalantha TaxID=152367 RepID=A0AAP0EWY2_9MAGN
MPLIPLLFFLLSLSSFAPSHQGCYWMESCQNKWIGGCGSGHIVVDQSNECKGLCQEPEYAPCLPFYTHFHCCKPESPKVTDKCTRCKNKLDYGDEYICCIDCSDPSIIDTNTKLGYCKTGAELVSQIKRQEHFKWVAGPWMPCSSPCDGGVSYRDVECFRETENRSIPRFPVDDSRCLGEEMPARQEPCNLRSCSDVSNKDLVETDRGGMPVWLVLFLVLFGAAAICGLGFAGCTMYKRRASSQHGFVYIMLESYN